MDYKIRGKVMMTMKKMKKQRKFDILSDRWAQVCFCFFSFRPTSTPVKIVKNKDEEHKKKK